MESDLVVLIVIFLIGICFIVKLGSGLHHSDYHRLLVEFKLLWGHVRKIGLSFFVFFSLEIIGIWSKHRLHDLSSELLLMLNLLC